MQQNQWLVSKQLSIAKKYAMLGVLSFLLLSQSANVFAQLNVLACEPEWAALVKELGGERVKVSSATTAAQDPHHIQARPSLIAKARRAELLVCTGAELEVGWLPLLQRKSANGNIQTGQSGYFMTTDFVLLKGQPEVLDRSEGDIHAAGNPHIGLDPHLILEVADALHKRLQQLDGNNRDYYEQRYQSFREKWLTAIKSWEQKARVLKEKQIVVHHNSWMYLNDWLGLKTVATLEPKPGIPPTLGHLGQLLNQMKQQPADLIVYSSYQSPRSAKWLGERTKIPVVALPHTVGGDKHTTDLFGLFERIIDVLVKGVMANG